jgi:hypothetical protein
MVAGAAFHPQWLLRLRELRPTGRVPTLDIRNAKGRGQECPRHTGLARGGGQDFVMGHARPSLQQEFFIFGIEHGFLRIGTGKGFDGVP